MSTARKAPGFSSLAVLDRLVYLNYEPLTTLAAATVTDRIRLARTRHEYPPILFVPLSSPVPKYSIDDLKGIEFMSDPVF